MTDRDQVIAETEHLRFVKRANWSFVERTTASGVVCIIACTSDNRLVLIEQFRPPVDCRVIELPAGLAGDVADQSDEPLSEAAQRELVEETGYRAKTLRNIATVASNPGMTNEVVTFFQAEGIEKIGAGGGVESESIIVHEVPLAEVDTWLRKAQDDGNLIDARVYAGLHFLRQRDDGTSQS